MARKSSALRLAPPTSAPLTFGNAHQLARVVGLHRAAIENAHAAGPAPHSASPAPRAGGRAPRPRRPPSASVPCRWPTPARRRRRCWRRVAASGSEPASWRHHDGERRARPCARPPSRRCTRWPSARRDARPPPWPARRASRLAVVGAPLGMPHDHGRGACVLQHLGRDIAGMRAARRLGVAILAAHQQPRAGSCLAPWPPTSVAGGQIMTSTPAADRRLGQPLSHASRLASELARPFIFQLPATSGRMRNFSSWRSRRVDDAAVSATFAREGPPLAAAVPRFL